MNFIAFNHGINSLKILNNILAHNLEGEIWLLQLKKEEGENVNN